MVQNGVAVRVYGKATRTLAQVALIVLTVGALRVIIVQDITNSQKEGFADVEVV